MLPGEEAMTRSPDVPPTALEAGRCWGSWLPVIQHDAGTVIPCRICDAPVELVECPRDGNADPFPGTGGPRTGPH
jgi:hypothetical protein